jgi:hypothetical protein
MTLPVGALSLAVVGSEIGDGDGVGAFVGVWVGVAVGDAVGEGVGDVAAFGWVVHAVRSRATMISARIHFTVSRLASDASDLPA